MKKKIVLLGLLALPLVLYIYFSMAKHNSLFLPVITENINELPQGKTFSDSVVMLKGRISIVGFLGTDVIKRKESIFNIDQKLNEKYRAFKDFQVVMLMPDGTQESVKKIEESLKTMGDISNWKFVFTTPEEIKKFYSSLKVKEPLGDDLGTFNIFIVDKALNVRGRKGEVKNKKDSVYKDGYNSFSAADLHNDMTDDVKIVLREYRLALRRNATEKGVKREI
jgi:hypothetical protein